MKVEVGFKECSKCQYNMRCGECWLPAEIERYKKILENLVWCKDCKYCRIENTEKVYAICVKTSYIFEPFETDTREHYCSFGERKEEE